MSTEQKTKPKGVYLRDPDVMAALDLLIGRGITPEIYANVVGLIEIDQLIKDFPPQAPGAQPSSSAAVALASSCGGSAVDTHQAGDRKQPETQPRGHPSSQSNQKEDS